jgi:membrane protein
VVSSLGLRIYLHYFNSYSVTYGSLGAVIVLLTWFYLSGFMLLLGAEINGAVEAIAAEKGDPGAKAPGEKTPPSESKPELKSA